MSEEFPIPTEAAASGRWLITLGTGALCHIDPSLVELAELTMTVAGASTQAAARGQLMALRAKARSMRQQMPPMAARALSRLVRRAEGASGGVLDKRARVQELKAAWHELLGQLDRHR